MAHTQQKRFIPLLLIGAAVACLYVDYLFFNWLFGLIGISWETVGVIVISVIAIFLYISVFVDPIKKTVVLPK